MSIVLVACGLCFSHKMVKNKSHAPGAITNNAQCGVMPVRPSCGMALVRFLRHDAAGSVQDRTGARVSIGPLRQPGGDRRQMEPDTAAVCAGAGYTRNFQGQLHHESLPGSRAGPTRKTQDRSQVWAGGLAGVKGTGDTDAVATVSVSYTHLTLPTILLV